MISSQDLEQLLSMQTTQKSMEDKLSTLSAKIEEFTTQIQFITNIQEQDQSETSTNADTIKVLKIKMAKLAEQQVQLNTFCDQLPRFKELESLYTTAHKEAISNVEHQATLYQK